MASQGGNINYTAANSVTQSWNVTRAAGQISLTNLTQEYTGSAITADVVTSPTGISYSVTYNGLSVGPTNVGTYEAIALITDPLIYGGVTNTLTITKASQTITFPAVAAMHTNSSAGLSATGGGSGNAIAFNVLSGAAAISSLTNLDVLGAGDVLVTADQASNANYDAAPTVTNLVRVFSVSPDNGPLAGGNTIIITNGSLGTVTNAIVVQASQPATVGAGGTTWVTLTMPAATNTGMTDITLQSTEYGDILLAAAYTYNPAGKIGEHNMVEYRIDFSNNSNPDYPTNTSPDGSYIWTHFQRTNDWKELKTIHGTANDSWILAYGFAAGTSGGWNTGAGGYDWIASDAANVLMYSMANYTNYIAITNLPGSSYQVDVVNSFNQSGHPTVAETLHSGLYQLGEEADNGNYGNWPSGGNTNAGLHLDPCDLYNSRTNYVTWTNAVPSNGAISIVLEKTLPNANMLNCMRVRGDEGSSGVAPVSGSWTGGYEVVITGINFGNGSDITNVTLCGFVASITGQSSTSVTVTAGAASTGSSGDVVVQSTSYGTTIGSNLFTYVAPNLSVLGTNGAAIASSDAIDLAKGSKFYATKPNMALTNTFAITNSGNDVLSISGWTTNGADAALFTT